MASTVENLKVAFAGESQANRKYLAFAKKAEKEGSDRLRSCSARRPRPRRSTRTRTSQNMGGVGSTLENLREAIAGETHEFTEMYPPMVAQAIAEQHKAKTMLEWATGVERVHASLFKQALAALESGQDLRRWTSTCAPSAATSSSAFRRRSAPCAARRARSTRRSGSAERSRSVPRRGS